MSNILNKKITTDKTKKLSACNDFIEASSNNTNGSKVVKTINKISFELSRSINLVTTSTNRTEILTRLFKENLKDHTQEIKHALGGKDVILLENILNLISHSKNTQRRNLLTLFKGCGYSWKELKNITSKIISNQSKEGENKTRTFPSEKVYKEVMLSDVDTFSYETPQRESFVILKQSLYEIMHHFFYLNSHTSTYTNRNLDEIFILHFENDSSL